MDNYHKLCKEYLEKIKPLLNGRSDLEYDTLVKLCGTGDAVTMADVKYRCEALFKKLQGSNAPDIEIVYIETGNDCSNLRQQNQLLMDKLNMLENNLNNTISKQVAELTASKNQTEVQKEINAKLTNNVTVFRNQIDNAHTELKTAADTNNKLKDMLDNEKKNNASNTDYINELKNSIKTNEAEIDARVKKLEEINTKLTDQITKAKIMQEETEKNLKRVNLENDSSQAKITKMTKMTLWNTEQQERMPNIIYEYQNENEKLQNDLKKTKMENIKYADKQIIWELKYNDLKNTENILKLQRNALQDYETMQKDLWDQITDIRVVSPEQMQSYIDLKVVIESLSKSSFAKFNEDLTKMDVSNIDKLINITVEYLRNAMPNAIDDAKYEADLLTEFMEVKPNDSETDVNTILKIKYFVAVFQMNRDILLKYRNDHKNAFPPNAKSPSEFNDLETLEKDGYAGMMMTTEKYLHKDIDKNNRKKYGHVKIDINESDLKEYNSDGFLEQYIKLRTYLVTNVADVLDIKKRKRYAEIFRFVLSQTKPFIEILSNNDVTLTNKLTNILERDTLFYYINEILNKPLNKNDLIMLYHAISFCKSESENVKEISQSLFLDKLIEKNITEKYEYEEGEYEEGEYEEGEYEEGDYEEGEYEDEEEEEKDAVIRIHKEYTEHKTKLDATNSTYFIYMIDNKDHPGEILLDVETTEIEPNGMEDGVLKLDKDIATHHIDDVLKTRELGEIRKKMTELLNNQSNLKSGTYGGYDNDVSQYDGVAFGGVMGGAILFSENAVAVLLVTCILLLMYLIHILYYQPGSNGYKNRSKCGRGSLQNNEAIQYIAY